MANDKKVTVSKSTATPAKTVVKPAVKPVAKPVVKIQKAPAPKVAAAKPAVSKTVKVQSKPVQKAVSTPAPRKDVAVDAPILEFDPVSRPIITAGDLYDSRKRVGRCLITYFQDVVDKLEAEGAIQSVFKIRTEGLRPLVYEMRTEGGWSGEQIYITVIASGAPSVARTIETMSAMGVKKFMICSGAGTINEAVTLDKILIPSSAVRDEGTSYHYLPAAREVRLGKVANTRIENVLNKSGEKHMRVKTWTTDAPFRETLNKVTARRREGCSVVDTECAAAYAVAEHKKLTLGQIMIAGDIVKKDGWDYRAWTAATELREKLFHLAVKCLMEF